MTDKKRGGWVNPASADNGRIATGGGRPPVKAEVRAGDDVFVSHVNAEGWADLGRGAAAVRKIGRDRLIVLAQPDGSEVRILVVHGARQ